MSIKWLETVVCTKPVPKPRINKWRWRKIYDSNEAGDTGTSVQFWISPIDLKESAVEYAKEAFGKALEQIIRLGSHPQVLYPTHLDDTVE
jgi:hypothetical protein